MSGLEVVGSVASVLQLAATVYTISKTLYEVGGALSNAPSEINDLARDLETFSEELHLLSSLLEDKTRRYSDRVHKLTTKIIGDCASICIKIDKILRKLRNGSFLARVKWVFKEKEIMKLLMRLRDLKLSLMGTLSLLSALKADHMMDAMGVGKSSLLERQSDEKLERGAEEQVAATSKAIAAISTSQNSHPSFFTIDSTATPTLSVSNVDMESQKIPGSGKEEVKVSAAKSLYSVAHTGRLTHNRMESETLDNPAIISTIALPKVHSFTQLPLAMESVESFHSARSRQDNKEVLSDEFVLDGINEDPQKASDQSIAEWRIEMAEVAMKRFHMDHTAAVSWASQLPLPNPSRVEVGSNILKEHEVSETQNQNKRAVMKSPSGSIYFNQVSKVSSTYVSPCTEIEVEEGRVIELEIKDLKMEEPLTGEDWSTEEEEFWKRKMELKKKKKALKKLREMRSERLKALARGEPQSDLKYDSYVSSMICSQSVREDNRVQRRPHTQNRDSVLKNKIISPQPDLPMYFGVNPSRSKALEMESEVTQRPSGGKSSRPNSFFSSSLAENNHYMPLVESWLQSNHLHERVEISGLLLDQEGSTNRPSDKLIFVLPSGERVFRKKLRSWPGDEKSESKSNSHVFKSSRSIGKDSADNPQDNLPFMTPLGQWTLRRKPRSWAGDEHSSDSRPYSFTRNYRSGPSKREHPLSWHAEERISGTMNPSSPSTTTPTTIGVNTTVRETFRMGASNAESFRKATYAKYHPSQGDTVPVPLMVADKHTNIASVTSRNGLNDQSQLWNRAFFKIQTGKMEDSLGLWEAWQLAFSNLHIIPGATEDFVARVAASDLVPIIEKARIEFLQLSAESTNIAASSTSRFFDILKVMQETLNFQPGAFVWTCLCATEKKLIKNISNHSGLEDPYILALADISEIATLVARYNVLESIYRHWLGMSLHKDYEESLVDLSVKVLGYLNLVLTNKFDLKTNKNLMDDVREADMKCRRFSVMIEEEGTEAFEFGIQDIDIDSSDSDSSSGAGSGCGDEGDDK